MRGTFLGKYRGLPTFDSPIREREGKSVTTKAKGVSKQYLVTTCTGSLKRNRTYLMISKSIYIYNNIYIYLISISIYVLQGFISK